MLISRAIYIENENVNLEKGALETAITQLACLRASLGVICNAMRPALLTVLTLFWALTTLCQDTKLVLKQFSNSKQISESYSVLRSDGQIKHGEYVAYFVATKNEYKQIKRRTLKLDGFIKQKGNYKNGQKDGEWVEYSRPYSLKTKGNYDNDKKVGIWLTYKEQGHVLERFDYDNNKKLPPIIVVNAPYPKSAMIAELQGTVIVSFQTHKDCSITDIRVTKSLSVDCDKVAIEAINKYSEFYKKYGIECDEKTEMQEVQFKLE